MILVCNKGAPLHVMQGDSLFSLVCTFMWLWQHDASCSRQTLLIHKYLTQSYLIVDHLPLTYPQKILTSTLTLLTLTCVPLRVCKPLHITNGHIMHQKKKGCVHRIMQIAVLQNNLNSGLHPFPSPQDNTFHSSTDSGWNRQESN